MVVEHIGAEFMKERVDLLGDDACLLVLPVTVFLDSPSVRFERLHPIARFQACRPI